MRRLDVFLSNGRFIVVYENIEEVLDSIISGSDDFIEITDKEGNVHYVGIEHIVEAKLIEHETARRFEE